MSTEISSSNEAPELKETRDHLFATTSILMDIVALQQRPDSRNVKRVLGNGIFNDDEKEYLRNYRVPIKDKRVLFDEKCDLELNKLKGAALDALHRKSPSSIPMLLVSGIYPEDDIQAELDDIEKSLPSTQSWAQLRITADSVRSKGGTVVFPSKDFISGIPILAHCGPDGEKVIFEAAPIRIQDTNRRISGYSDSFEIVEAMFSNPHRP